MSRKETFEKWFNPFDEEIGQASKYEAIKHVWNHQQDKIEELEKEVLTLKVNLNTCKNDYSFMVNLLEKYSTDKEQAIGDCIERMRFRKPLFSMLSKNN